MAYNLLELKDRRHDVNGVAWVRVWTGPRTKVRANAPAREAAAPSGLEIGSGAKVADVRFEAAGDDLHEHMVVTYYLPGTGAYSLSEERVERHDDHMVEGWTYRRVLLGATATVHANAPVLGAAMPAALGGDTAALVNHVGFRPHKDPLLEYLVVSFFKPEGYA